MITAALRKLSPVHRDVVLSVDVNQIADAPSCAVFTRVGEVDIDEALDISHETEAARCVMQHRLNCGDWCIAGRVDGKLAFYAWVMFGAMEIGARVRPVPNEYAFSYKLHAAPEYRRRGIASAYYAFLKRELSKDGRRDHVVASIAADDEASRRLHVRCGFASLGSVWTMRGTTRAVATDSVVQLVDEADARQSSHPMAMPIRA